MPCMLLPCFEGAKEDWFCQLGHPRKIKNLLTYLLTYSLSHFFGHFSGWIEGNLCTQLLQFNTDTFETLQTL